jgi:hypothetical protein
MGEREDAAGCAGILLATVISLFLWLGLWWMFRLMAQMVSVEGVVKATAGTLALAGSWLVIRACVELDR